MAWVAIRADRIAESADTKAGNAGLCCFDGREFVAAYST